MIERLDKFRVNTDLETEDDGAGRAERVGVLRGEGAGEIG